MSGKREVDTNKLQIVEEYAQLQEDLTAYVKEQGYKMSGNTMSCPFHGSDSTPSLKINGSKWKCFGCGRGGGYLKFRMEQALLENSKVHYYDVVEKYMHERSDVAAQVGGTIFKSTEESFNEQWERMMNVAEGIHYKPNRIKVKSNNILIQKAKGQPVEIRMRLLSGIQDDLPYEVLESIVNGSDITGKTLLELSFG